MRLGPSAAPERERGLPARQSCGLVPGAVRCPRLLCPRRFSREPVSSASLCLGKLSPQGQLLARVTQLHQRLLVSAASSLLPGPGPGPVGPRAARAAAKTWPTLALSGRAVAGEGRRVPGKVPAAATPAQNCAERGDLGGDRGDATRPRSGGAASPAGDRVYTLGQQPR